MLTRLKEKAGYWFLDREVEPERKRRGVNLTTAKSVAFLYLDEDEAYFSEIKKLVRSLHEDFGTPRVCALAYVDQSAKHLPVYHAQKLEYMYFTKSDLNWHLKPKVSLMNFLHEPFELLIDLRLKPSIPMDYILKRSQASMKCGANLSGASDLYDFNLDLRSETSMNEYWEQMRFYLTNLQLR